MKTCPDLREVRIISFDVDGVLTDGKLCWGGQGLSGLNFNVKDGTAIKELLKKDFHIVVVSANKSEIVVNRMQHLGLRHTYIGVDDKLSFMREFVSNQGLGMQNVLHVADDRNDLPLLREVGTAVCPSDSISEVKEICRWHLKSKGGDGVAVELLDQFK